MGQSVTRQDVLQALGRGFTQSTIIACALLALLCMFYVYSAASHVELRVYPLIDRVIYYAPFIAYIINEYVDHIILVCLLILWTVFASKKSKSQYVAVGIFALLFVIVAVINYDPVLDGMALSTLPSIIVLLIYNKFAKIKVLNLVVAGLTPTYLAITSGTIGIMGVVLVSISVFSTEPLLGQPVRIYAYDVFLILSSFSPVLILLLITCVPTKIISDFIVRGMKMQQFLSNLPRHAVAKQYRIVYLLLIMLLSVLLAIIPHLETVNPDGQQVGVDTGFYVNWVGALQESSDPIELLYQAFVIQNQGDRPLSLLFLHALSRTIGADTFDVVEHVPVLLAPALALATYFLTRELTSNEIAALFSAFVTVVSFQVLIGIYAGFYANWFALIIGYISFVFLFRFLKQKKTRDLALYGVLTILVLFAHVYTWTILSIVAGVFLLVGIIRPGSLLASRLHIALAIIVILIAFGVDVGRTILVGSSGGVEADLELAGKLVGPDQFILRWNNLSYTTTTFVGGLFSNFVILGLGLYWLVRTRIQDFAGIFILIFLSIGILPFIIGEWVIQTRVFYNIPFQIPAAMALALIMSDKKRSVIVIALSVLLVFAASVALSNYYLVKPEFPSTSLG